MTGRKLNDWPRIESRHAGAVQDVKMVAWHPDGDVLASASYDDTIKLWIESDDEWICAQTLVGMQLSALTSLWNPVILNMWTEATLHAQ